ncbi:MAG: hypothetical protein ACREVI_09240 [Steroidobacteraceae bacterium]
MARLQHAPGIETIIKDPAKHFRKPAEVVGDASLSADQKRKILESWAQDAKLIAVAEEENMGGDDRPGLQEVKLALLELEKQE